MKNHLSKSIKSILGGAFFCLEALMFVSCDNFMKGADTKEQLDKIIEYNNAQFYTIRVNADKGCGVVKSPAGGVAQKKVSDSFEVSFDANADYEFISWKIIDSRTKKEYTNGEYLLLDSLDKDIVTCTFVKAPGDGVQLTLYAEVVKRPRIISRSPQWDASGAYRDSRIQVMFDCDMDEQSIYYTDQEKKELKQEYGLTDYDFISNNESKTYACKIDGVLNYKNISLEDYNTGRLLTNNFSEPYFEDSRTLVIPANDSQLLTAGTQILVVIGKGFFCYKMEKTVSLKEDETWVYYLNTKTDTEPPEISAPPVIKNKDASGVLSTNAGAPTLLQQATLNISSLDIMDEGSGPNGFFNLKMAGKDSEGNYTLTKTVKVPYTEINYPSAKHNGNFVLPAYVTDGDYKITEIEVSDKNGRSTKESLNYFVTVDATPPEITSYTVGVPPIVVNNLNHTSSPDLIFSFNTSDNDIDKIFIKKRIQGSGTPWEDIGATELTDFTENTFTIAGETTNGYGKTYELNIEFIDKAGNSFVLDDNKGYMNRPNKATSASVMFADSDCNSIKVKWTCPQGNYSGVIIKVKRDTDPLNRYIFEDPNKLGVCTTSKVKFFGTNNTIEVIAFARNEYGTCEAIPAEATIKRPVINNIDSTASSIKILDLIEGQYYVVSYKVSGGNDEFTSCPGFTADSNSYVITGLSPATIYSVKVEEYDSASATAPLFTYTVSGMTRSAAPENLKATTQILTSPTVRPKIELTWDRPQGSFEKYTGSVVEWNQNMTQFNGTIATFNLDSTVTTQTIAQNSSGRNLTQGCPYKVQLKTKLSNGLESKAAEVYVCTPYQITKTKTKNDGIKISYTILSSSAFSDNRNYTEMKLYYGVNAEAAMNSTNSKEICSGYGLSGAKTITVEQGDLSSTGGVNTCFVIKVILTLNKNESGETEINSWWPVD